MGADARRVPAHIMHVSAAAIRARHRARSPARASRGPAKCSLAGLLAAHANGCRCLSPSIETATNVIERVWGRFRVTRGLRLKLVASLLIGRYSQGAPPDRQGERVTADYAIESPVLNKRNIGPILSEDPCAQTSILQPAVPVQI